MESSSRGRRSARRNATASRARKTSLSPTFRGHSWDADTQGAEIPSAAASNAGIGDRQYRTSSEEALAARPQKIGGRPPRPKQK